DLLPSSGYEIGLPTKVMFTLQPNSLASKAVLTIDGSPHNFDSGGLLSVMVDSGVSHAMTITSPIQTSVDTRYVASWDNAYSNNAVSSNTLNFDQDSSIAISFQRQFLLTVKSDVGNVSGGGWYNEGSTAAFSSPSNSLMWTFEGWALVTASNNGSIEMDAPHTLTARWIPGYLLVGICIIAVVAFSMLYYRRRRGPSEKHKPEPQAQETGTADVKRTGR